MLFQPLTIQVYHIPFLGMGSEIKKALIYKGFVTVYLNRQGCFVSPNHQQRVTGLSIPHTEFAPSPQCLKRLFIIQGGWNRAPPIQRKRAQNRGLLGGVSAPSSPP